MRRINITILIFLILSLNGCFQILHHLRLNDDGSIDVYWQFDISRTLAEKDKKSGKGSKKESILDKINKIKDQLPKKLKPYATNIEANKIDDEFQTGISISFKAKKYMNIPKEEEFTILPKYDQKKNSLIFEFNPQKKDKKGEQKKNEKIKKNNDMGMEKIVDLIMSSARYQVILGGNYVPVRAKIKGKKTGKNYSVAVTKLGTQYLIVIPFMSISMKEVDGFDLVIYLK